MRKGAGEENALDAGGGPVGQLTIRRELIKKGSGSGVTLKLKGVVYRKKWQKVAKTGTRKRGVGWAEKGRTEEKRRILEIVEKPPKIQNHEAATYNIGPLIK